MDHTLAQQGIRTLSTQQVMAPTALQQVNLTTPAQRATSGPATYSAQGLAVDKRGDGIRDSFLADMIRSKKKEKHIDYFELATKMCPTRDEDYVIDLIEGRVRPTENDVKVLKEELGLSQVVVYYISFTKF